MSISLTAWQRGPLLVLGAYALFCAAVILLQRRLLYFPQRLTAKEADEAYAFYGLSRWPEGSGPALRGLVAKAGPEAAVAVGTVLVFHGNAGGAHERVDYCDTLQRLGWRVILAEYPGYGERGGELAESSFREDGRATARLVRQRYTGPLVLLGESLGCAVMASVAADPELKADAVVLATPWDRLETVAATHYPWLPIRYFLRDRYDSVAYLKEYRGPVTLLMAEDDEIIPAKSTMALYDALPHADRKRLIHIPLAGHNEWFSFVTDVQWRDILPK